MTSVQNSSSGIYLYIWEIYCCILKKFNLFDNCTWLQWRPRPDIHICGLPPPAPAPVARGIRPNFSNDLRKATLNHLGHQIRGDGEGIWGFLHIFHSTLHKIRKFGVATTYNLHFDGTYRKNHQTCLINISKSVTWHEPDAGWRQSL